MMGHSLLTVLLFASIIFGLVFGTVLLIVWAKKIYRPLVQRTEEQAHSTGVIALNSISMRALWYMLPGLAIFTACCTPAIYFNYWLKQERYCVEVVKVNKWIQKNDPFLHERCSALDIDDIFRSARGE